MPVTPLNMSIHPNPRNPIGEYEGPLYDHRNLFVVEIGPLVQEGLCPFLQEMDTREYNQVWAEYLRLSQMPRANIGPLALGGGAGLVAGFTAAALGGPAAMLGILAGGIVALTSLGFSDKEIAFHGEVRRINGDRLTRLDMKIREIADRILQLQQIVPINQREINQLLTAQAHFQLKYQQRVHQINQIRINVHHH